ncbi:hypothetical protein KUCAC02_003927 [Chaenocephalus aceratus]|uniref:Uncharacterized protein n=1 Tax=Chaenocephalus aceratus TaxID=36190 RepID=A0ACB9WYK9_CHAAC|nr:hypothetical protein KUCAC02_003927 [Chaenocephalus aceratus]
MQYLEDLRKCEPPDLAAGDAKILLRSINFQFLLCLEITTPVFLETSMAYNALQQKDLDLAAAYTVVDGVLRRGQVLRTDEKFTEIFMKAEALDIEIPEQIPGQGRRWKVPEKFKYSSTSANEDHHVLTLEEYYRGKLYFTFLYILRQELERRFRGEGKNSSDILRSLHSLTDPAQWKNIDQGLNTVHSLCEFYGFQGEEIHLKTELRVFHATYTCPERTAKAMLDVFKEFDVHTIFPTLFKLIKTYATLPVSTATVEHTKREIPVDNNEVMMIFIEMAPNRRLLL